MSHFILLTGEKFYHRINRGGVLSSYEQEIVYLIVLTKGQMIGEVSPHTLKKFEEISGWSMNSQVSWTQARLIFCEGPVQIKKLGPFKYIFICIG